MAKFVPQIPKSNSLRDRAIAAIIDRLRLRQDKFIYENIIRRWCETDFCIEPLSSAEMTYIGQESGLGIFWISEEEEEEE